LRRKMAIQEMAAGLSVTQAGRCEKKDAAAVRGSGSAEGG